MLFRSESVPYDLTGDWIGTGKDVQKPFCGGDTTKEEGEIEVSIVQSGDDVTMIIPDDSDEQILFGRTSNHFIAVESSDQNQVTVFSGNVTEDANKIIGNIIFFDKHACPDAETGKNKLVFRRN